jgi:hypothetical protein
MQTRFKRFAFLAFSTLVFTARYSCDSVFAEESKLELTATELIRGGAAELEVVIVQGGNTDATRTRLPARVTITDSAQKHPDGSGRGVYMDGRFFVDGQFAVQVPPGNTRLQINCGPHTVPLDTNVQIEAGKRLTYFAKMQRWFDPQKLGWFCGDNHVHTQHDRQTAIRVGPDYTALQARANDLAFITEADNEITAEMGRKYDTESFLYRTAPEIRPGPFVGHLNTPGISHPLAPDRYQQLVKRPLPRQALHSAVRELGGAMIHTHPFTPAYQLHWMGAAEAWSDAALGKTADLLDLDYPVSQLFWFAILNLGNRIGCSNYTDCALGRLDTPSPGDRRVYCKADKLDYDLIVEAMRSGRTVATNGGPIFVSANLGDRGIGETVTAKREEELPLQIECESLLPLRKLELFCGGEVAKSFDVQGQQNHVTTTASIDPRRHPADWYVVRAENERGDWSITSPIYVDKRPEGNQEKAPTAHALLLEISNHTRYTELRRDFFAHLLVTVRPPESLREVKLLRDGQALRAFKPEDGDQWHDGRVPVTDITGDYGPGWAWHPEGDAICHLQADWPVTDSGWYSVEATTTSGRALRSDELRFNADDQPSQAISVAHLEGPSTSLAYRGYGEEMPRSQIQLPFKGDHWWYPDRTYWRLEATFFGRQQYLDGIGNQDAPALFRERSGR